MCKFQIAALSLHFQRFTCSEKRETKTPAKMRPQNWATSKKGGQRGTGWELCWTPCEPFELAACASCCCYRRCCKCQVKRLQAEIIGLIFYAACILKRYPLLFFIFSSRALLDSIRNGRRWWAGRAVVGAQPVCIVHACLRFAASVPRPLPPPCPALSSLATCELWFFLQIVIKCVAQRQIKSRKKTFAGKQFKSK